MNNRYLIVMLIAMAAAAVTGPLLIPLLHRLKFGQSIRQEGLQSHYKKTGTPTMGGFIIYLGLLAGLLFAGQWTRTIGVLLLLVFGHGLLGFADDYIKSARKNPEGLSARAKLIGQFSLAALFCWLLAGKGLTTELVLPLLHWQLPLGFFYWILALLYLVFFSNAVNIIDGVDGLCSGQTMIATLFCFFVALLQQQTDLAAFCAALIGALAGFLLFNLHPARIFMGDTGSLGLGAALAAMALLLKVEALMLWVGMVFIIDIFSTIIQVLYFKATKGKRLFKMSPIHHHFELCGWSEWKIVFVFWACGLFFTLTGAWLFIA
ncbi:MAG: phospho-N-acetylmuramoyl-pentapeptide-transferase [Negativicutes bacterium]|nr:phospho-N-acetylmuramoyl-pentapeptide-transferase [Negativicutes bacterium]